MSTAKLNIGIAGGGITGLVGGLELQDAGHTVSIFEARSRTGGRIHSIELGGMIVETGPEFIHGHGKETVRLLNKFKIGFEQSYGKMYRAMSGQLIEDDEVVSGWDQLLEKMRLLKQDLPFQEFLEENFTGDRFTELRQAAIGFAEGFDLADAHTASTIALFEEWKVEDMEQYRVPAGYGSLIESLTNEFCSRGGKIFLNHPVRQVDWNTDTIRIRVQDEKEFVMDKLMVSLPFSAFNKSGPKNESIVFTPSLGKKETVVDGIGFGNVIKIVMIWNSPFWIERIPEAQFVFSKCFIPTWWTQYPRELPMLTGWLGGPKALLFEDKPDDFFLDKAMESLSEIFSVSRQVLNERLKEFRVFNWKNEAWSRGAYCYFRVGFEKAINVWKEAVGGNIYFAGEAYYTGPHPGTVEASVLNGIDTARRLLSDIN
jgi:monoamine oxidase